MNKRTFLLTPIKASLHLKIKYMVIATGEKMQSNITLDFTAATKHCVVDWGQDKVIS